ncbi:hypothetical protein [Halegenticoccus tardaugens]|uniref:hypothetical protein n=1 Tax=Halegenticoccus tardaugens TaxID=2071624 RepID=UPI0013E95C3E|nr:hypothetical protein [Halegenticoccus tardaugens]
MAVRCKLCRRTMATREVQHYCNCGWTMDHRCAEAHVHWCPRHGEDAWVGAVEI